MGERRDTLERFGVTLGETERERLERIEDREVGDTGELYLALIL